ncbi:MAG TPA: phenylalanine--tRNA ligase beta subunit-related protein [Solirubrobacteraceae bacterium]|jgi:DNA/RNA-binding domain of Phe-tRNA-synthetase-like protein
MPTQDSPQSKRPELGWVAREVQEEFPELHLIAVEIEAEVGSASPPSLARQVRQISDRWSGARAINLRREPVPAAYRVFFRHIGLDPDVTRTPIEAAIFERLMDGGFLSRGRLVDVLLLALIETGVPVWALDAATIDGPLGIRLSQGEPLGSTDEARMLPVGQMVIADAHSALAVLFGEIAAEHQPLPSTRRLMLFTVQVAGVSMMHVEEALWMCTSALTD